jgi:hypothetical protein
VNRPTYYVICAHEGGDEWVLDKVASMHAAEACAIAGAMLFADARERALVERARSPMTYIEIRAARRGLMLRRFLVSSEFGQVERVD